MSFAIVTIAAGASISQIVEYLPGALSSPTWWLMGVPAGETSPLSISGGFGGALTNAALLSGAFGTAGTYNITVSVADQSAPPVMVSGVIQFVVTGTVSSSLAPVITAPGALTLAAGAPFNYQLYATGEPTVWSIPLLPAGLSVSNAGCITGTVYQAGTYTFEATATNANGTSEPEAVTLTVSAPASSNQLPAVATFLPWIASDISLTDLQFDLRGRGITSFYALGGSLSFFQGGTCKLALVLLTPTQVNDATTIWLTARQSEDGESIIKETFTGSVALTAVTGGEYYLLPIDLTASRIVEALDDMDAPKDGTPRVLSLEAQVTVARGTAIYPSLPFKITIYQRIAQANIPADRP